MSHRTVVAAVVISLGLLSVPAAASAGVLVPPAGKCSDDGAQRAFARWLDPFHYVLAPDGGFERRAAGWTLSRGAEVVSGNEPWRVAGADHRHALRLPPGSRVTSPPICVATRHPTIRFFARNTGSRLGLLSVQVVARTSLGLTLALPTGVVLNPSREWAPTLPMPLLVNLLTLVDGSTHVRLRFTPVGRSSSWEIDDVYLDPYRKG